ncbi:hypothetical protein GTY77_18180 [Streptomyces sp. SID8380]|nr:hypothetical protein [Streptomyces sp. SID8380]
MNNQVKLLDAEKLLSWLSERMSGSGSDDRYYAFEWVHEAVESGEFDPDTPPVPTIKPGDSATQNQTEFEEDDEVTHKVHGQGRLICTTSTGIAVVYFYEQNRDRNVFLNELTKIN